MAMVHQHRAFRWAAILAVNVGVLAATVARAERPGERFWVGACTHFCQGKGLVEQNIESILLAGIDSIRDEVVWSAIEREKGKLEMPERFDTYVRRAAAEGLDVLLILNYANRFYDDGDRPRSPEAIEGFCRYAEYVVGYFGKQVRRYEIWNEWDIGIGLPEPYRQGGSPEDYVRLLRAVYPRIKAVDSAVTVIAGASTSGGVKRGWLEEILKRGALESCDAISIHGYNYNEPFPQRSPESCSTWMTGVQAMIRSYNDGQEVPFYVTEMGWPTHDGRGGTCPQLSASYLARLYLLARQSPSLRGIWWYDFQDDGWDPGYNEHHFGLVRPDLTPKPAYHVLADIAPLVSRGRFLDRLPTDDQHLWILRFRLDAVDCWAVWSGDDRERQVVFENSQPAQPLTVRQAGHAPRTQSWGFRDWVQRQPLHENRLSIVAGPRPILIGTDLSGVSVVDVIPRPREKESSP
jgi:hypothetical protein